MTGEVAAGWGWGVRIKKIPLGEKFLPSPLKGGMVLLLFQGKSKPPPNFYRVQDPESGGGTRPRGVTQH